MINTGDTAWVLASAGLVLLMTHAAAVYNPALEEA